MSNWLTVPSERLGELETLNTDFADRKCTTSETINGEHVTSDDKLQDEYWSGYHEFLLGLSVYEGEPEFPVSDQEA